MMPREKISEKKVLILSHDVAGKAMAGPGIRYTAIANELAKHFQTTLGLLDGTDTQTAELANKYTFPVRPFSRNDFEELFSEADYIFAQWLSPEMLQFAREKRKRVIFDLYAPVPIEFLLSRYFSGTGWGALEKQEVNETIETYRQYIRQGDYFVCSNLRQRDMWVGFFLATGVLSERPKAYADLNQLIGIAPMGIDSNPAIHTKNVLRRVVPGIEKDDFILLWTGGLWDWFDPLTVIKAVEKSHQNNPKIKLVFMGMRHPNKKVPDMLEAKKAITYVKQKGLENKSVFFVDKWLPYEERINYLLEADAAIYAHKPSLETRYSHRTRVLDHIFAELPTIANGGDYIGDKLLKENQFGIVANNTDIDSFAKAISTLAKDAKLQASIKQNIAKAKPEFLWEHATKSLVSYIKEHEPLSRLPINQAFSIPARKRGLLFQLRRVLRKIKRHV